MYASSLVAFLVASSVALAAPQGLFTGCELNDNNMPLKDDLHFPTDGSKPTYLALGVGVQNYTCNAATGNFTSAGAVANLYDISCMQGIPLFGVLQDKTTDAPEGDVKALEDFLAITSVKLGQHYFVSNAAGGISPKFEFTPGFFGWFNPRGYLVAKKVTDVVSPLFSSINWLGLDATEGDLAKHVFRVDTARGLPPTSCKAGETISVPYAAKYWFWK